MPEGADSSDAGAAEKRSRFLIPIAAALAVILFMGGAYAFGKYAGSGSPSFLANISSLFRETFSGGVAPTTSGVGAPTSSRGVGVETIPLGGEREILSSGGGERTASSAAPSRTAPAVSLCALPSGAALSHSVLINEVAWAGTASDQSAKEWIELMNPGSAAVSLAGWQLVNKSGGIRVAFGGAHAIEGEGYFLLERKDDTAVPGVPADAFFQSAIRNSDETLTLFDVQCGLVDEVKAEEGSGKRWPAGEAYPNYRTAERAPDFSWYTYSGAGSNGIFGTPKAENTVPAARPAPVVQTQSLVTSTVAVASSSGVQSQSQTPTSSSASAAGSGRVLISGVMAGMEGNGDYEFVELFNTDDHAVNLTGWYMKKRSSTGKESSLVSANAAEPSASLEGKIIKAGHYLLLANSSGYTGAVAADVCWPKSYTLAYKDNAVILYNAVGVKVDEVSWAEIPKGSSYARMPVNSSSFTIQAVPTPQNSLAAP